VLDPTHCECGGPGVGGDPGRAYRHRAGLFTTLLTENSVSTDEDHRSRPKTDDHQSIATPQLRGQIVTISEHQCTPVTSPSTMLYSL
jgi:hypothetical protein